MIYKLFLQQEAPEVEVAIFLHYVQRGGIEKNKRSSWEVDMHENSNKTLHKRDTRNCLRYWYSKVEQRKLNWSLRSTLAMLWVLEIFIILL